VRTREARYVVLIALTVYVGSSGCKKKSEPTLVPLAASGSTVLPLTKQLPGPVRNGEMRTLQVNGVTRRYLWIGAGESDSGGQPTAATERRRPLVLVFHGDGGDARGFHAGFPFEVASGAAAHVAYPEGRGATWDLETKAGNADSAFVVALIAELSAREGVDEGRVYAAGYSSGGFLANMLACRHPALLRGVSSSAAGAPYAEAERHENGFPKCPGQKATAVIALHGRRDFGVEWKSGKFSAEYWAYVNGCNMHEWEPTGYPECRAYRGCPRAAGVVFCDIEPLGHWVWGEAAAVSWEFFSRQESR
jgi:poly(3-hydroxybutyrate) depolymerase